MTILTFLYLLLPILVQTTQCHSQSHANKNDVITRFQTYLKINTAQPNPDYKTATNFITSEAESLNLHAEVYEFVKGKPVVVVKWEGTDRKLKSVLLNSHTDVVPVEKTKWLYDPFEGKVDGDGRIYARGSQVFEFVKGKPVVVVKWEGTDTKLKSVLLNSHTDKWLYDPFEGKVDGEGRIYARGSQDMKCVGMQYLEAIRNLKSSGFTPLRTVYLTFVPDEEIGGHDGAEKFAESKIFEEMNVGIVLDEGLASPGENYRAFYAERCPWWLVIKSSGAPGHGAKLYDNTAMENLLKSVESVRRFRASQFDQVKAGLKEEGEVVSVNMVFLKAGTPSPTGFVMNLQPSEAEAGFDIRIPPTADLAALERRISDEWAPASRNMTFEFKQKGTIYSKSGKPKITATDSSNPWWGLLEGAVEKAKGKLGKPEIFPASTDARYFRERGLPAIGFSPMANTPILLHDHNEFLTSDEYLKGIVAYESIIKAYSSYGEDGNTKANRDEL